ncbi:kinase domain protein (macronuclear) [Tetrahymena thermophila SB210]|uniref:Kinase domain protein n=1 Tax=Tetrahymena thermophila (strain SB210) TaxID=312017 RepID=I7MAU7_TETTS|nr:kinase domain protein [Tetrahymena thermophila SB210]EAS06178.1 kinase domain protein [Tetrahymena thermophila SB210]|eukprot:XP_001026423.1 kinase domain protein [Tetrahymena thermophila SB210]
MIKSKFYQFLILLSVSLIYCQQPQNWLFSPQYSYIINAKDQQSQFSKIKVSTKTGLIFVSQGDAGIMVVDPQQQFQVIASFATTDNIMGFTQTKDSNYLFMSNNGYLTVFDFSDRKNFVQVAQDTSRVFIVDVKMSPDEQNLYIFQINGNVRILDISTKTSPQYVGSITWQKSQIYTGLVTPDENFILLCQDSYGLAIFALNKSPGSVTGTLAASFPGLTQGYSHNVILTPDSKYIINLDQRNGLSIGDFTQITSANPSSYPLTVNYFLNQWWPSRVTIPSPYSFCLSNDGNFLFLGVRSIGIYTIDITNKQAPSVYQWSYFPFHGNAIALSPTGNYLYFSNAVSLMIFRKTVPIIGQKYVSLYNTLQTRGFDKSNTKFYWRCDYDPTRQAYIGGFNTDGLWVLDVSDPTQFNILKQQYKPPGQSAPIDSFYFKDSHKTLLVSMNDGINFLAVIDASDYTNLQIIQKVPLGQPFPGYIKDVDSNNADTLLGFSMDRTIVFVDTSVLGSYFVLAIWNFLPSMKGFTTGVMISRSEKHFVGACRGYGYFVLDIQDFNNIQLVNYVNSNGAEQVYMSVAFAYQYYLVDGLGGLYIMDQTKLPELVAFSQVVVDGWTNDVTYLKGEKTVIISTLQQGMIYLVDIYDNKNPFIVSSFQYGGQNGLFTCATDDFTRLFINNNVMMRQLPMSVTAYLHTDYIQILGYSPQGDMLFTIINDPDNFQFSVGQTIKINLCYLYQPLDLVVSRVQLYQKQVAYPLPYWISYNPVEVSLQIQILKEAVDPTNLDQPLLNTIVLTSLNPLSSSDFTFTVGSCQTNSAQATSIFNQLQSAGTIDENNLVSPDLHYDDYEQITFSDTTLFPNTSGAQKTYNTCVSGLVKFALLNSIQFTPIYMRIYPSLDLILDNSTQDYISTQAQIVNIIIEIPKFSGRFIYVNQPSVNIQVNQEANILSITGLLANVNSFLRKKIIIFPVPPLKYSQIIATVTVSDSMNYPVVKNLPVSQFPFLVQKQNIEVNPKKTLQSQFSDNIFILTQFGFTIDPQSFIVPDFNTTITYKVLISKNNKFQPFDNTDWLQYNSDGQNFYGNPPQTAFQKSYTVQVTASDGFTKISDTFTVHVNQLPVLFVIQWIATILGPLTGALGAYKFRNVFYNILYHKKTRYSTILCQPNEQFYLKIPLIFNEQKAARQIIKSLLKILEHKKITYNDIVLNKVDSGSQQLNQVQGQNLRKLVSQQSQVIFDGSVNDIYSLSQFMRKKLPSLKNSSKKTKIEVFYLKQNGDFNFEALKQDLTTYDIQFILNSVQTSTKTLKEDFEDEYSTMGICIKYQLVKSLIKMDQKSYQIYKYIKKYSLLLNPQLSESDWYKYYLSIESNEDLDKQGRIYTFPFLSLKINQFLEPFIKLRLIDQEKISILDQENIGDIERQSIYNSVSSQGVNLYLIEEAMRGKAFGVTNKASSSIFPSYGESVHLEPYQISSLVALRYAPGESLKWLQKLLGLDYKPYGPKGNMQLPSWLTLDMQQGLILMKGVPELQNVEDILIRIYTQSQCIIRHFVLRVEENQAEVKKVREESHSRHEYSKKGQKQRRKNSQQIEGSQQDSQEDLYKDPNGSPFSKVLPRPSIFLSAQTKGSPQTPLYQMDGFKEQSQFVVNKSKDKDNHNEGDDDLMKQIENLEL